MLKGRTYEQIHGVEKAKELRLLRSIARKGKVSPCKGQKRDYRGKSYEERFGKDKAIEIKRKSSLAHTGQISLKRGKTFEELYGIEKAQQLRINHSRVLDKGKTFLRDKIRRLSEYVQWRKDVFNRDNYICQSCNQCGGHLEAHHLKEFCIILEEFLQHYHQFSPIEDKETLVRLAITYQPFWDVPNGKTLCKPCHDETKNGSIRKGGNNESG